MLSSLFIILFVLKVLGLVTSSWWVVFAPLLIGFVFFFIWGGLVVMTAGHGFR